MLDYELDVPSRRDLSIDGSVTFANISDTEVAVTLDLTVSGPNGDVRVVGTSGVNGGTFTVKVNGDTFAKITFAGSALDHRRRCRRPAHAGRGAGAGGGVRLV